MEESTDYMEKLGNKLDSLSDTQTAVPSDYDLENSSSPSSSQSQSKSVSKLNMMNRSKLTIFYCFEISYGLSILVRLQILASLFVFYNLFVKVITTPFGDDPKIQIFFAILLISNLPRFYAGYLGWQWFQYDCKKTRL